MCKCPQLSLPSLLPSEDNFIFVLLRGFWFWYYCLGNFIMRKEEKTEMEYEDKDSNQNTQKAERKRNKRKESFLASRESVMGIESKGKKSCGSPRVDMQRNGERGFLKIYLGTGFFKFGIINISDQIIPFCGKGAVMCIVRILRSILGLSLPDASSSPPVITIKVSTVIAKYLLRGQIFHN